MRSILRSGYTQHRTRKVITVRRGGKVIRYTRKAGSSYVKPTPIPDVGAAGKGPKLIGPLKGGMLTKYGYHPVEAKTNRYKSLMKGIRMGEHPLSVLRRLVAISTLSKRAAPRASRIYKQDARWIAQKFLKMK